MERDRYSIHQQAAEVAGNFEGRMQRAEALALNIGDSITNARHGLLNEDRAYWKNRLGYNPEMDSAVYQIVTSYRSTDKLEHLVYCKAKEALDKFTRFQLETHLGERFNVLSSSYKLNIKNGAVWAEGDTEPFRHMLIRGQEYRKHHGSMELEREQAEVDGFIDNEPLLCDPRIPDGTIFLSFSPKGKVGSIYQHNFYDMLIRRTDKDGKPYLEARRYSSALSASEYVPKTMELNPFYKIQDGIDTDDVFWKKRIIRVTNSLYNTPEKTHEFLHKEHDYMSDKQFAFIRNGVSPYIDAYIQILSNNPYDSEMQNLSYRAILNRADELWGMLSGKSGGQVIYDSRAVFEPTMYDIRLLGSQDVRRVLGACGFSGDEKNPDPFNTDPVGKMLEDLFGSLFRVPFGVSEFGKDESFNCPNPECGKKITPPFGDACPHGCGLTKANAAKYGISVC